ncbi:hypothetical protein FQA39_LY16741 [Lamprigera yunnana]|nr:hypothetical protein FQA39_LY16741 [Lamprigera yunnana]
MMLMFLFCFASLALAFSNGQEELANLIVAWKDMLIPNNDICIKDSGVNEADIISFFETFKLGYNHKLNCYFECQEIQLKFIDLNGNFNITEIINTVAGVDEEIAKECARQFQYEKDICDKGFSLVKCCVQKILININKH